jgi:hypothetical protein
MQAYSATCPLLVVTRNVIHNEVSQKLTSEDRETMLIWQSLVAALFLSKDDELRDATKRELLVKENESSR